MTAAEHLEGNWVGWLTADSELEEIEFGDRYFLARSVISGSVVASGTRTA